MLNDVGKIWVYDPIEASPLARALIVELEMTGLEYSEKLNVLAEVYAAITLNKAKKASAAVGGKIKVPEMVVNSLCYFSQLVQMTTKKLSG